MINDFVGIPYGFREDAGLDCWQIAIKVLKTEYKKDVPDYHYAGKWNEVEGKFNECKKDFVKVDKPQKGDIILFRVCGIVAHCGVVVGDAIMIHTMKGHNSCVERFTSPKWVNRIEGYYRWL